LGLKIPTKKIKNDKSTHLVLKLSNTSSHTRSVSFATLRLLYQCAGPACPIPQQLGVVFRRYL